MPRIVCNEQLSDEYPQLIWAEVRTSNRQTQRSAIHRNLCQRKYTEKIACQLIGQVFDRIEPISLDFYANSVNIQIPEFEMKLKFSQLTEF